MIRSALAGVLVSLVVACSPASENDVSSNDSNLMGMDGKPTSPEVEPTHRVHSLLPASEATVLQGIFDRLGIAPAACSSQAVIGPPAEWNPDSSAWWVQYPHDGALSASEAEAMAAIFDRLEVAPTRPVEFYRADHTDCFPQNGIATWQVRYEQVN
jgi:hypothetical protein